MSNAILKNAGISLAIYATTILMAGLPIFAKPLTPGQAGGLAGSALVALGLVALLRAVGKVRFLDADFVQAFLGVAICCGLYTVVSHSARPEIMLIVCALWVAASLPHLSPKGVLALMALYLTAYLRVFSGALLDGSDALHSEATFMLIVCVPLASFLYWRASQYQQARDRLRLHEAALEEAETRIRDITSQDSETTALKYAYFRGQLLKEKVRVDSEGGTFSVGLIEIDGFEALKDRIGETATAQLLREFTERVTKLILRVDPHGRWAEDYKPLGRISGGRFSMILPMTDFEGAMRYAERLHSAVDFKAIRTSIGVVGVTLSIGVTEYAKRESPDELMELAARALMLAQKHNGNDYRGLKRPQGGVVPTKEGLDAWNARPAVPVSRASG